MKILNGKRFLRLSKYIQVERMVQACNISRFCANRSNFVFVSNSNVARYSSFGIDTLILGLIYRWAIDDTFGAYANLCGERISIQLGVPAIKKEQILDDAQNFLIAAAGIRWAGLLIWIGIILSSI